MRYGFSLLAIALLAASASSVVALPEEVSFATRTETNSSLPIRGHMLKPDGQGPFPAIIFLHGHWGVLPDHFPRLRYYVDHGYVVLLIDSNSVNDSEGRRRQYATGAYSDADQAQDAHRAKEYLGSLQYVNPNRIGVVSWGGGALYAASRTPSLQNGVRFEVERSNAFAAAAAFYPDCVAELISLDAPLLILIGANDTDSSVSYCQKMKLIGHSERTFEVYVEPGAAHGFDWDSTATIQKSDDRVLTYFERYLRQ